MAATVSERPVYISKQNIALVELASERIAERIGDELAVRVVATWEGAPPQTPSPDEGATTQQLIYGPNGTGTADSVYSVAGCRAVYPLSVMCRLTCSNAVADRTVALEYREPGGQRYLVMGSQAVVQANGQQSFCWYPDAGGVAWPVEDAAISPLSQQYVYYGHQLALKVWNGDAGDVLDQVRISARFVPEPRAVEEL